MRLAHLATAEARILADLPASPTMHGGCRQAEPRAASPGRGSGGVFVWGARRFKRAFAVPSTATRAPCFGAQRGGIMSPRTASLLFHSPIFLCAFLPLVLLLAWGGGRVARNGVLLLTSLFFYAWGEGRMVGVLAASAVVHWALAGVVARRRTLASHVALGAGSRSTWGCCCSSSTPGGCWGRCPPWPSLSGPRGPRVLDRRQLLHLPGPLLPGRRPSGVVPPSGPFKFALYLSLFRS